MVLVLLLVAAIVYAFITRPRPASPVSTPASFVACNSTNTLDLTVAAGSQKVELTRASVASAWQSAESVDPSQVAAILDMLGGTTTVTTISSPGPVIQYGLASPAVVVTCRVISGSSVNLSLGDQSFDASGDYAQKLGDPRVYVISGDEVVRFKAFLGGPTSPTPSP